MLRPVSPEPEGFENPQERIDWWGLLGFPAPPFFLAPIVYCRVSGWVYAPHEECYHELIKPMGAIMHQLAS
jgi:hypothetical protein